MKKIKYVAVAIAIIALCLALGVATDHVRKAEGQTVATTTPEAIAPVDPLTHRQRLWLGALEWCESRGIPSAVNPKDRDNTPSYGVLQFKPSTFKSFSRLYGITATSTMNDAAQEAIVEQMIVRGGVNWHQQFPDCVAKLGLPPANPAKRS